MLGGKLATLVIFSTLFLILGFAVAIGSSLILAGVMGTSASLPALGTILQGFATGWLIMLVWSAGGFALGLLFRSTTMPIGLGLIWGLAAENLIGALGGSVICSTRFRKD